MPDSFSHQLRIPALRHLAWMCKAPQLLMEPLGIDFSDQLPSDLWASLEKWDHNPAEGPPVLRETPHRRLGLYFEQLYECLMSDILGWEVLARNLPIRNGTKTLGELDFVVRNPNTGRVEHHEIAVKFYLGYRSAETGETAWYGPNAKDRLDIKTRRLLAHQSRLTQYEEARAALKLLGIHDPPMPRIFMPGYLFYPLEAALNPPAQMPDDHARGGWLYLEQARGMNTQAWVQLHKPHWLGPWMQSEPAENAHIEAALNGIESTGRPRLFARVAWDRQAGCWLEENRFFVVPRYWPSCENQR